VIWIIKSRKAKHRGILQRPNSRACPKDQRKNGRSSAKHIASERLRCGTIQKEVSWILQLMSAGAVRRIFTVYPA